MVAGRDCPSLISRKAVEKIGQYLTVELPGTVVVDGRRAMVEGDPNGYYIGPSVILYDTMEAMPEEEVFGPTLKLFRWRRWKKRIAYQKLFAVWQRRFNLYRYRFVRKGSVAGLIQRHAGD